MDAFERWKKSSWREQHKERQPVECLGCLKQDRYGSEISCPLLQLLLDSMKAAQALATCPDKVTM